MEIELNITDKLPVAELLSLQEHEHIDSLYIRSEKAITTEVTRLLKKVKSLHKLTIWKEMTRTALRDCFAINNLASLHLFELNDIGRNIDTSQATSLKSVSIEFSSMTDLCIFSRLPALTELRAHGSDWTVELLQRMASNPRLTLLDIENCRLTQEMVNVIATSNTITQLDVGDSVLTGQGLKTFAQMQQLTSLDIWNTKVCAEDLAVLASLENLHYLSIGGYAGQKYLDMVNAIPHILNIPNLTSIWVDNVLLTDEQYTLLEKHIETVRYDFYDELEE